MGANLAREVAKGFFCEATVGAKSPENQKMFKDLFQNENFRISCVADAHTVELCGALKVSFGNLIKILMEFLIILYYLEYCRMCRRIHGWFGPWGKKMIFKY